MSQRTFTLFHFSLVEIQQLDIATRTRDTREQWLRHALSETFEFAQRGGGAVHWVPVGAAGASILGVLERERPREQHEPPELGGGEIVRSEWQGAYVLIDPTHHDQGQRASIENDVVGKPSGLLKSLAAAINARPEAPYQIEIEPLFDAQRFWTFAAKHGNLLSQVTFDFVVPNMWGAETDLENELKATGADTGAERVKVGISSRHGVKAKSQKITDGVEYAEKGAGTIHATAPDGSKFSSANRPKSVKIPMVKVDKTDVLGYFGALFGKILGHEQNDTVDDLDRNDDSPSID